MNDEISRSFFHVRDLAVYIGSLSFQLLTALAAGSFVFFLRFGKIDQPRHYLTIQKPKIRTDTVTCVQLEQGMQQVNYYRT